MTAATQDRAAAALAAFTATAAGRELSGAEKVAGRVVAQVAAGATAAEALDAVCGAGTAAALISSLYDELRARAA